MPLIPLSGFPKMSEVSTEKPRRYPSSGQPAEPINTRLNASELERVREHAKQHNITTSAALRDLARRGMDLPSLINQDQ